MVNSIALNVAEPSAEKGQGTDRLLGGHIGDPRADATETLADTDTTTEEPGDAGEPATGQLATQMALFSLSEWQEAIFARIVDKVGTRTYWEDWARDVADIANALITRIIAHLGADTAVTAAFEQFLQGLRDNLNGSITAADAVSMLAQHLITKPVFDALFIGHEFAASNPVSQVMETMIDRLGDAGLGAETANLERFYASVRVRAAEVTTLESKQQVVADLYDRFFTIGFAKQADALGNVSTPVEIVDFILRSAEDVLRQHFGHGLTDEGVHIIDGFTGTGTVITRLLQAGFIRPDDLVRKYREEFHANEIMLLTYYIAAVNIETIYADDSYIRAIK
jgi:predicted helicase